MMQRNEATWNTMISGYVRVDRHWEALEFFCLMQKHGMSINGFVMATLLTACSRLSLGDCGMQLHTLSAKSGLLADVFVSTSLLHLYATCFSVLSLARSHFQEMPHRNIVSWTAMMVAYARHGASESVIDLYRKMRLQGISANQNAFAVVISSCGSFGDKILGSQVIGHALVTGFGRDVSVCNAMIVMYGNQRSLEGAYLVFQNMTERDTITWNSLISTYSQNGALEKCFMAFGCMRLNNVQPNATTLSSVLTACSSSSANLRWGMGVHGHTVKVGLDSTVSFSNALITLYSTSGNIAQSELIFKLMPEKDLISWNCLMTCFVHNRHFVAALDLFSDMLRTQKEINYVTFISSLSACSNPDYLVEGKIVHSLLIRAGLQSNKLLSNALITMYGNCGAVEDAYRLFLSMKDPDVVSWNAMIGGFSENQTVDKAIKVFNMMRKRVKQGNYITMVNVLSAFLVKEHLNKWGSPFHALVVSYGFESHEYVANALLTMYARCGELHMSNKLFKESPVSDDIVAWNAVIAANAHHGCGEEALRLFRQMGSDGLELDRFTLSGGLAASAAIATIEAGQQIHDLIVKLGFESDNHVISAVTDMYCKCGEIDDAVKVFESTYNPDRMLWNVLISGYARHGYVRRALQTFEKMMQCEVHPDNVTFISLFSACNHGGLVDLGLHYFYLMTEEMRILPGIEHFVCIVDILGRAGRLYDAEKFIAEKVVSPNVQIWRSMLASCRIHGNLESGKRAAERLLELDPHDDSAHVLLSNIYAAEGRWEHVENLRSHMKSSNIRKTPSCSWIKVKNRVHTFGTGDRSHPQAELIYDRLQTLLDIVKGIGYVADTRYVLHDMDEEQKEQNLWCHSEKLALAFGLLNSPVSSTLRIFKNLRICGDCHTVFKLVSQATSCRIVLRDLYRFHHFQGGACSCSDYW